MRYVFALLLVLPGLALAEGEQDPDGRKLVDDFVAKVQTMSGRFEQQLVDPDGIVVEKSAGTLEIMRPGRFRWSYFDPYEQILIADGLNVWTYDVDLEQVTVKPQAEALGSTPALLLGGSSEVLDEFDYVGSFDDEDVVWVRLQPKNTENGFTRVELGFADGNLTSMILSDNLEQSTLIALFDVTRNEPIDAHRFQFSPPEGVDVVGEPVVASPTEH